MSRLLALLLSVCISVNAYANFGLDEPHFTQNGDTYGSAFVFGPLDNFGINFQANASVKMRLFTSGGLSLGGAADPGAGNIAALGALHVFGTAGTGTLFTVGQGTTGADASTFRVRSGNSGTTAPFIVLARNTTDLAQWTTDGTNTFQDYTGVLNFRSGVSGLTKVSFSAAGNFVAVGSTHTLGTAGASTLLTVGQGIAGSDNAQVSLLSGSSGQTAFNLSSGAGALARFQTDGTNTNIDYTGTLTFNSGVSGTARATFTSSGSSTAVGSTHTFGTAGTATTLTIGQGTTGSDAATLRVRSGNTTTTAPSVILTRNASDLAQLTTNGTDTFLDYTGALDHRSGIAGSVRIRFPAAGGFLAGTTPGEFTVNSTGNLTKINNATYSWPSSYGAGTTLLNNDGSGNLTWSTSTALSIPTGTGTATQVAYWSGTNALTSSANLFWDNTNKRLGIGTATPGRGLQIDASTTGQTLLNGSNGEMLSLAYGTNTSADSLWLAQARGVIGGATAIQSGDQMGGVNFVGHDGAGFAVGARILGQAAETWASGTTSRGSEMRFFTTPTGGGGGAVLTLRSRITAGGDMTLSSAVVGSARDLIVNNTDNTNTSSHSRFLAQAGGTSGGDPYIRFNVPSGTIPDWSVGSDNSVGQLFKISRSTTLGVNDALTIDGSNNVTITTLNTAPVAVVIGEANSFAHANLGGI